MEGGEKMAQVHGMTDSQFQKHLADTLLILSTARKQIVGDAPLLDEFIENLKGQITKP
jgi:hypothetical protein